MSRSDEKIQELKAQIVKWAEEYDNVVSYTMVADILKEEDKEIEAEKLEYIIYELSVGGITIDAFEQGESYQADAEEPDKFIPADVNISQQPMNIYNLMERLEYGEINLHPNFQRNSGLWSLEKQSQLIESLMLKIPLPAFYFDASEEGKWIVIDGLQRLTAFKNFLVGDEENGYEKMPFQKMQYLTEFNGLTFDQLPRQYIRRIKESTVIAYTVEKGTPDEVVFNIFQRINTGGLRLEDQEIRQALYSGAATELTKKLAESQEFLEATQYAVRPERMLDREYINRFLAFTELNYQSEYQGNIDNFLIKGLKKVNKYNEEELQVIEARFKRIMGYARDIFGKYAFRKYSMEWRRAPINKALFELWSICFKELSDKELDDIVNRKDEFLVKFQKLLQDPDFVTALKAGDAYSYKRRVSMAQKMIGDFLC